MTRTEFIKAIFSFCGKNDDFVEAIKLYDRALTVPYSVDWEKFFDYVAFNLEKRSLPLPKYFREKISQFRKAEIINSTKDIGSTLRFFFSNGKFHDYTLCGYGISIGEIIEKSQNAHNVTMILKYPPTITLIGKNYYPEDAVAEVIYKQ